MEKLIIEGKRKLYGKVELLAAKNALLPLLSAGLLATGEVVFHNCPNILDVDNMLKIIRSLGCRAEQSERTIRLDAQGLNRFDIENRLAKELRSSIFLMGAILGRTRRAIITYPGGCDIGLRPINLHIEGLKALNVKIIEEGGQIICDGENLRGGYVHLDFPSVGATENIMLAAATARGTTTISNAAKEPEIVDLQNFLNKMGGKVRGAGGETVEIEGVASLHGCEYCPIGDRIVAGTYLIAAALCGGNLELQNADCGHLSALIGKLKESSCKIVCNGDKISISINSFIMPPRLIQTLPYPGFPTDLQAQIFALCTVGDGYSIIEENMFETRFRHANDLKRMGADVTVKGRTAFISGVKTLTGAEVNAYDLRGGAAMVIAGLSAEGTTTIGGIKHIDRGYEKIERDFSALGAKIKRIKVNDEEGDTV